LRRRDDLDGKLDFGAECLPFNSSQSAALVHMRARSSNWLRTPGTSASSACLVHSREYSQYFSASPGMSKILLTISFLHPKIKAVAEKASSPSD